MRLIDFFIPMIFQAMQLVGNKAPAAQAYREVRDDLEAKLGQAEARARRAGFDPGDVQAAKFAVSAFLDETVLLSSWDGRDEWSVLPLCRFFFDTGKAGVEFFSMIEALPAGKRQVREVFGLCLALGFKGRYYDDRQAADLDKVISANLREIFGRPVDRMNLGTLRLFPEAYQGARSAGRGRLWRSLNPFNILIFLTPPILYLTLYVIYRFYLGKTILDFFRPLV
ncbi:MAG: DotU family type IV/VI secretion system protein [Pseudomonadota bacterium]